MYTRKDSGWRFEMKLHKKNKYRIKLNHQDKQYLLSTQHNCCKTCACVIDDIFDVDHKIPLCFGGTDSIPNMQVLCLQCHRMKSRYEMQHLNYGACYCKQCKQVFSRHFINNHIHRATAAKAEAPQFA